MYQQSTPQKLGRPICSNRVSWLLLELPLEVTRLFKPTSMKKMKRFGTACIELGTHRLSHEEGCNMRESANRIQKCHTDVGSLVSPASWKLVSSLVPRCQGGRQAAASCRDGLRRLPKTKLIKTATVTRYDFGILQRHLVSLGHLKFQRLVDPSNSRKVR